MAANHNTWRISAQNSSELNRRLHNDEAEDSLRLSLSMPTWHLYCRNSPHQISLPTAGTQNQADLLQRIRQSNHNQAVPPAPIAADSVAIPQRRVRRNAEALDAKKIDPPFPWAADRPARVYTLSHLCETQIFTISGEVMCMKCDQKLTINFDLLQKFSEVSGYIAKNENRMYHRAPNVWLKPKYPECRACMAKNSVKPVMASKKRMINWLFLFLGQMVGCCTLVQLKYFCKHTGNHYTGAKDRLLFLTYMSLWRQLDPNGEFRS